MTKENSSLRTSVVYGKGQVQGKGERAFIDHQPSRVVLFVHALLLRLPHLSPWRESDTLVLRVWARVDHRGLGGWGGLGSSGRRGVGVAGPEGSSGGEGDALVLGVGTGCDDVGSRERSSHRSDAGRRVAGDVAGGRIGAGSSSRGRGSGRRLPESSTWGEGGGLVQGVWTSGDQGVLGARGGSLVEAEGRYRTGLDHSPQNRSLRRRGRLREVLGGVGRGHTAVQRHLSPSVQGGLLPGTSVSDSTHFLGCTEGDDAGKFSGR